MKKVTLLGLVTDGDVRRGLDSGSNFLEWPVEDMMTAMPRTITKDKLAAEALHLMEKINHVQLLFYLL